MSRLLDPTICPDCRQSLDPAGTCTGCGLRLQGPLAGELWRVMQSADGIVERLRLVTAGAPVTSPESPTTPVDLGATLPRFPSRATPARTRRLPAASVPVVLLSLGALCLLVAAVVFVAVTWSLLGLTGRTLVLAGVTALFATAAVLLTRRGLRGAAETFWLIVAGMLTLDLLGAQSAGLAGLDALDWRGTGALVGGALTALGLLVGLWGRSQPVSRLLGAESVAVLGALVLTSTNAWSAQDPAVGSALAAPVLVALLVALRRLVPVAAYGLGILGAVSWLVLLLTGVGRALEVNAVGPWWSDLSGWPLLVAASLAAAVVLVPRTPSSLHAVAAGAALLPLGVLANSPATEGQPTLDLLRGSLTVVALGLVAGFAPRAWSRGATPLAVLGTGALGIWVLAGPWPSFDGLVLDGDTPMTRVLRIADTTRPAAWILLAVAAAVVAASTCLTRVLPDHERADGERAVRTLAPAALALGLVSLVLGLEPTLWVGVVTALVASLVAGASTWWSRDHLLAGLLGSAATAYLALMTLWAASASDLLAALTLTTYAVTLAAAFVLRQVEDATTSPAALAALAAAAGGGALASWTSVADLSTSTLAVALGVYAGLVVLAASRVSRRTTTRLALEGTAALLAASAAFTAPDDTVLAMVLTVVGSAIAILAVTERDRFLVGWLGAAVLGGATLLRVVEDVRAPELYTLPAAALLVGAGVWRLRADREVSSLDVLGSGLLLALVPSLLLALEEPVSLRGALVGAAGVLTLAVGVNRRLVAPFALGALTTGVLAVRHLQPVAEAVPRWVSLGAVGLALLVVGVTWEARRRNLETAGRYLAELR
jgi:hypothetical protein